MTAYTMDILVSYQPDSLAPNYYFINFRPAVTTWPDFSLTTDLSRYVFIGTTDDPLGNITYPTIEAAIEGEYSLFATTLLANANGQESGFYTFVLGNRINWDASLSYNYDYLVTQLGAKFNKPTGTTGQFILGDGSLAARATIPTNTNQLTNGANFITSSGAPVQSVNGQTGAVTITLPSVARAISGLTLSLVGTGATGTQVSTTKPSSIRVTVSTSATASISGSAVSTVTLKSCATNSATETDWVTEAVSETSQSYSLAIALSGVTGMKEQLTADIPAAYYVKLVNTGSGTHSETFIAGRQTIYG